MQIGLIKNCDKIQDSIDRPLTLLCHHVHYTSYKLLNRPRHHFYGPPCMLYYRVTCIIVKYFNAKKLNVLRSPQSYNFGITVYAILVKFYLRNSAIYIT